MDAVHICTVQQHPPASSLTRSRWSVSFLQVTSAPRGSKGHQQEDPVGPSPGRLRVATLTETSDIGRTLPRFSFENDVCACVCVHHIYTCYMSCVCTRVCMHCMDGYTCIMCVTVHTCTHCMYMLRMCCVTVHTCTCTARAYCMCIMSQHTCVCMHCTCVLHVCCLASGTGTCTCIDHTGSPDMIPNHRKDLLVLCLDSSPHATSMDTAYASLLGYTQHSSHPALLSHLQAQRTESCLRVFKDPDCIFNS